MSAPDSKQAFQFHPVTSELVNEIEALSDEERQRVLREKLGRGAVDTLAAAGLLVGVIENDDGTTRFVNLGEDFGTNLRPDRNEGMVEAFDVHQTGGGIDETPQDNFDGSEQNALGQERGSRELAGQTSPSREAATAQESENASDIQPGEELSESAADNDRREEGHSTAPKVAERDSSVEIENQRAILANSVSILNARGIHGAMNGLLGDYMRVSGQELIPLANVRTALMSLEDGIVAALGYASTLRSTYDKAQDSSAAGRLNTLGTLLQGGLDQISGMSNELDGLMIRLRNNDNLRLTLHEVHQIESSIYSLSPFLNSVSNAMAGVLEQVKPIEGGR